MSDVCTKIPRWPPAPNNGGAGSGNGSRFTSYRLLHLPSGREMAAVIKAESWWAKGWGVLGRHSLPVEEGLWLPGVASVHTVGVRFSLDLLFLDRDFQTMKFVSRVPPGRLWVGRSGAAHTLELGAGTLAAHGLSIHAGDEWRLERLALPPC